MTKKALTSGLPLPEAYDLASDRATMYMFVKKWRSLGGKKLKPFDTWLREDMGIIPRTAMAVSLLFGPGSGKTVGHAYHPNHWTPCSKATMVVWLIPAIPYSLTRAA